MAEPLSSDKRAAMREIYLEYRSVESVVRHCDVNWHTAEKYRVEDQWDKAAARVDQLAEDIAVKKIAKRRADNIRIAQAALVKMAKDLDAKDKLTFSATDADKLSRLVEFLSGDPDSRPDTKASNIMIYVPDNGRGPKPNQPPDVGESTETNSE